MRTAPGPHEDGPLVETVGTTYSSPWAPGMHTAPGSREDGPLVKTVGTTFSSPPAPGLRTAPGLRQDGRLLAAVGTYPPAPDQLVTPGPGEDDCMIAAVAYPPRAPGVPGTLGPRVNDTSRKFPRAPSRLHILRQPPYPAVTPKHVRVALKCGYENTGRSKTTRALRSRSSRKTSRNLPLRTIIEDDRSVVSSDFHPDQSVVDDSSLGHGFSSEATELVGNKCPRQDNTCPP